MIKVNEQVILNYWTIQRSTVLRYKRKEDVLTPRHQLTFNVISSNTDHYRPRVFKAVQFLQAQRPIRGLTSFLTNQCLPSPASAVSTIHAFT